VLSGEAARRTVAALAARKAPDDIDLAAVRAEFAAILRGVWSPETGLVTS
jgi:hypothetical protein